MNQEDYLFDKLYGDVYFDHDSLDFIQSEHVASITDQTFVPSVSRSYEFLEIISDITGNSLRYDSENKLLEKSLSPFKRHYGKFEELAHKIAKDVLRNPLLKVNPNVLKTKYAHPNQLVTRYMRTEAGKIDWGFYSEMMQYLFFSRKDFIKEYGNINFLDHFSFSTQIKRSKSQIIDELNDFLYLKFSRGYPEYPIHLFSLLYKEKKYALSDAISTYFRTKDTDRIDWIGVAQHVFNKHPEWEQHIIVKNTKRPNFSSKEEAVKYYSQIVSEAAVEFGADKIYPEWIYRCCPEAYSFFVSHKIDWKELAFNLTGELSKKWRYRIHASRIESKIEYYNNLKEAQDLILDTGLEKNNWAYLRLSDREILEYVEKKEADNLIKITREVYINLARLIQKGNLDAQKLCEDMLYDKIMHTIESSDGKSYDSLSKIRDNSAVVKQHIHNALIACNHPDRAEEKNFIFDLVDYVKMRLRKPAMHQKGLVMSLDSKISNDSDAAWGLLIEDAGVQKPDNFES